MNLPQSWPERLAIINEFQVPNADVVRLFGTSERELDVARGLVQKGLIRVTTLSADAKNKWSAVLGSALKPVQSTTKRVEVESLKPQHQPVQINGKIKNAIENIPTEPVPVDQFVKQFGVSKSVLRQSKRFVGSAIKVSIRRDKQTKIEMICRVG